MNTETEERFKDTDMKLFGVPEREEREKRAVVI